MKCADLHTHTRYSDGTFAPAELVQRAAACGLSALALTDHDTMDGLPETARLCSAAGIEFIPGFELTAHIHEKEVHVLGYLFRQDEPELVRELERFKQGRTQRVLDMITKLKNLGIELTMEDVTSLADGATALGRLHVARALQKRGVTQQVDEAFQRFIGKGKPAFVPKFRLSVADAAGLIHRAGGVAIFAHPGIANLDSELGTLIDDGLDGIEVWHTRHTHAQVERYLAFTHSRHCLATGGSDCHGLAKDRILIGSVRLDYTYVEKLKDFHDRTLSKVS